MAQPYVGEIRIFAGTFAPVGWAMCDGTPMPISENETLFQLIGTTYGGDGKENFNLPDLRGRLPVHQGTGPDGISYQLAEMAGVETVTLTTQQMPVHSHVFLTSGATGNEINPSGNVPAKSVQIKPFINQGPDGALNAASVAPAGGSQPHDNRQPYLGLHFIISLFGIFPSPT